MFGDNADANRGELDCLHCRVGRLWWGSHRARSRLETRWSAACEDQPGTEPGVWTLSHSAHGGLLALP